MNKLIISSLFTIASVFGGVSFADENIKKIPIVKICDSKNSTQSAIRDLSDMELSRNWTFLLQDQRLKHLKNTREIDLFIDELKDCDMWNENLYNLEIKWMKKEAFDRNLYGVLNKVINGQIKYDYGRGELVEYGNGFWAPWSSYRK